MNKSPGAGRGPGRRPGVSDTRERILAVARRKFLAEGYQRVTMRAIAAEAGVDAALISYFFGSKSGLLVASLSLTTNPIELIGGAMRGPLDALPERILRTLLSTWDDPAYGGPLRAMLDAALTDPAVHALVKEMLEREMIERIAERIGGVGARARAGMAATQLAGLIFTRYVIGVEPIASMPIDELVTRLSPALRALLRPARG